MFSHPFYILVSFLLVNPNKGLPGGANGREPACQCKRLKRGGFDPWVGKMPWKRTWQPTPVLLPGEFPWTEESDTTE